MVALVVEDENRDPVREVTQTIFGERLRRLLALVHHPVRGISLLVLAFWRKPVPVRHEHSAGTHQLPILGRNDVELVVVVERVIGTKDLQALLDREIRSADQDATRKRSGGWVSAAVTE